MGVIIIQAVLSKNPVKTGEKFTISLSVKETVEEAKTHRLPFKLGQPKGGIK